MAEFFGYIIILIICGFILQMPTLTATTSRHLTAFLKHINGTMSFALPITPSLNFRPGFTMLTCHKSITDIKLFL